MRVKTSRFIRPAAAGLAVLLSFLAATAIYRAAPVTSDENSYLFQAHRFVEGRLRLPYPGPHAGAFFHFMIILDPEHGWLSRYPPGHPLWLTPGVWLGEPRLMVYLAAGLSVILLCAAGRQIGVSPGAAAAVLLLSPYFISMHGTLLSHTSGFLYSAAMLAAYLAWKRTWKGRYAVLAGLAWGMLFLNRTFAAGLIALPLGLDALFAGARNLRNRRALIGVALLAGAAGAGSLVYFEYNRRAVGDPGTPTYLYYEPSEKLGFGPRHTQGVTVDHTPAKGLRELRDNLVDLDLWLWGFRGSLAAALLLALAGWNAKYTPLLLGSAVSVWVGYIFFWFRGIPEVGGPVYYFEALPMILLGAGSGLESLHRRLVRRFPRWRMIWPALAVIAGLNTARVLRDRALTLRQPQERRRVISAALASAPPGSVVFVRNFKFPRVGELVFNLRGLESDPLLVDGRWGGALGAWIWERIFRDRPVFHINGQSPDRLVPLDFAEVPKEIFWEAVHTHRLVGVNETDGEGRRFRSAAPPAEPGIMSFGRHLILAPGERYRLSFNLRAGDDPAAARLDVVLDGGQVILAGKDLELPPGTDRTYLLEFQAPGMVWAEPRVHYEGGGKVMLDRVGLEWLSR